MWYSDAVPLASALQAWQTGWLMEPELLMQIISRCSLWTRPPDRLPVVPADWVSTSWSFSCLLTWSVDCLGFYLFELIAMWKWLYLCIKWFYSIAFMFPSLKHYYQNTHHLPSQSYPPWGEAQCLCRMPLCLNDGFEVTQDMRQDCWGGF